MGLHLDPGRHGGPAARRRPRLPERRQLLRGRHALLLAIGRMVEVAETAAERLAAEGIDCGVVNARWLKPIDTRLL